MGFLRSSVTGAAPNFDEHMLALGRLCVVWAFLDRLLNELIQEFLGCTMAQAAIIGTEADAAAARCKMLKNFATENPPSAAWRDAFTRVMDRILNDEGPKRNRYVHDYWTLASGSIERMDRRASVKREQAHQPPKLVFNTWQATPTKEVEDLSAKLAITALTLQCAKKDLEVWRREGRLSERALLLTMGLARETPPKPRPTRAAKRRE